MAQKNSDLQKINELIEIMKENDLVEVEIKHGDDKICLKRCQPQRPAVTAVPPASAGAGSVIPAQGQTSATEAEPSGQEQKDNLVVIKRFQLYYYKLLHNKLL